MVSGHLWSWGHLMGSGALGMLLVVSCPVLLLSASCIHQACCPAWLAPLLLHALLRSSYAVYKLALLTCRKAGDSSGKDLTVFDVGSLEELTGRSIAIDNHCFGCTAGSGSSCQGAVA